MQTKRCNKCKKEKPLNEFCKRSDSKDKKAHWCKECVSKWGKEYRQKDETKIRINKYYKDNKKEIREYQKEWSKKNRYINWARNTLRSHKTRNYIVEITINELTKVAKQIHYCPLCNTKLDWEVGTGFNSNSPTLDRTNNEKILTLSNTQIICHSCNTTKHNRTMKEFIEYCEMIVNKFVHKSGLFTQNEQEEYKEGTKFYEYNI